MSVFAIREPRFPPERTNEAPRVTKAIRADMRGFAGYLEHEIVQDMDAPGYLFVVSRWSSREAAGEVLARCSESPNARRVDGLVSRPGRRAAGRRITG